jgi:hypothetical protein
MRQITSLNPCRHYSQHLQTTFEAEGNGFLCTARLAEIGWFRDHAEAGALVRYLYVIEQNPRLVGG